MRLMPAPDHRHQLSRYQHAVRLWERFIAADRLPQLDRWLALEMKQQRQFGKKDRQAYSELLFAAVRFGYLAAFLDFARERLKPEERSGLGAFLSGCAEDFGRVFGEPDAAAKALRRLPPEILFSLTGWRYEAEKGAAWPLGEAVQPPDSPTLARLLAAMGAVEAPALRLLWQGIPLWFVGPLTARAQASGWSEATLEAFLRAQAQRPPLWLRLNRPDAAAEVVAECEQRGFEVEVDGAALKLRGDRPVYELRAFEGGLVEIQDWASQQIGIQVAAKPGELVWDACAGGGGKTMQIAAALRNRGAVYASDIREHKLKEVRRRSARGHFDNVRSFVWEGEELKALPREVAKQGGFHWVLVDAPCTSSGTWRRNPDAKFRGGPDSLPDLLGLQSRLLTNAARAVRPGGQLVYSTCSWMVEENEGVIARFLAANPSFQLRRQGLHGCPDRDADTMFSALLQHGV